MKQALVWDATGQKLAPCSAAKALALVQAGEAELLSQEPLAIRLFKTVALPQRLAPEPPALAGQTVLLHICCAPCATYVVRWLRGLEAQVTGHWFNPNIHPFSEHQRRRETLARYAQEIALPVIWEEGYEATTFFRVVVGHEAFRERCVLCYRLRLERTARVAAAQGFAFFSTTLLISPYQDQRALRQIGEELGATYGVRFYGENLRRGFAEHHRLAQEAGLYRQKYCGCLYSEWEALDRQAWTKPKGGSALAGEPAG
jgi:predicted adenine nucleotide alpha hydrolase (AANH) superfamily ATPase